MPQSKLTDYQPAELHFGSYRVVQPLGSGGMSSVYRAVHEETGHEVALKVLPANHARNPVVLQRFLREARSAESLEHPNIASIYDRGVDQGRHYLVLEYVPGNDLHEYIQRSGPLGAAAAVRIIRQVAEGLGFASKRGLVHRDVKPSNILRSGSGDIKIIDLGLALQTEFEDERVTREGTTVGTVDYMAPEQARDSRAANLRSDIYSLGCTFYYLLTGVPPYPGGDITDKLTRHAKAPPPDVRDLRPDVPEALARIMLRMMAKRPEDRFDSYEELIAALDAVEVADDRGVAAVALVPLDGPESGSLETPAILRGGFSLASEAVARPNSSIPEISLANLPPDLEPDSIFVQSPGGENGSAAQARTDGAGVPLPRGSGWEAIAAGGSPHAGLSIRAWISLSVLIGVFFVLSVIVIDRLVRSTPRDPSSPTTDLEPSPPDFVEPAAGLPRASFPAASVRRAPPRRLPPTRPQQNSPPAATQPVAVAAEPEDFDPRSAAADSYSTATLRKYLPEWALAPVPERVEGPLVQVRRVVESREPDERSTLRKALDETKGTVEIADEGPFLINDFRVFGEVRLIRARPGFRSIIRIERPTLEVVRSLPGVIVLEGKNLVLDSLDIIVNLRELPPAQTSLFSCTGASLTVRDCTITLVNQASQPFSVVRAEGSQGRDSRVRFERTLVRGHVSSVFDLGKGRADVAVRGSVFLGSHGPLVRLQEPDSGANHRFSAVGSVLAGQGPVFDLEDKKSKDTSRVEPLVIRSFDTIYGRFQGAGIASVIACDDSKAGVRDHIDWLGDQNVYCGWRGFFASGADRTIRVPNLAAFRSTWNRGEESSLEILIPWLRPSLLEQATPEDIAVNLPGRETILKRVAVPRPYLEAKTLSTFPPPTIPTPLFLTSQARSGARANTAVYNIKDPVARKQAAAHKFEQARLKGQQGGGSLLDLVFDTDTAQWHGDLGFFLREKLSEGVKHATVHVLGSGPRRCSPVRLPDGLILELRVEAPGPGESEWLSWSPEAEATGRALIELHGGSLILSQLRLRADESAAVESLIHVEDGDLVLHRCQLIAPAGTESKTHRLVSYSAAGTLPRPHAAVQIQPVFSPEPEQPVCVMLESILITGGVGVRAEVGRATVALSQCALAAGTDAIELLPTRVARRRFQADLWLDHCTIASQTNIIRLGPWPGWSPGPDRPWLITSRHNAFLGTYDRRVSETVLLRADELAMAQGTVFWQGSGDAVEVDAFTAVGDAPPPNRTRDVVLQWVNFWGSNHMREIMGPRASTNQRSIRLLDPPRPGRVEPADLMLDPDYHPGRARLDVGADLFGLGITPKTFSNGRRR